MLFNRECRLEVYNYTARILETLLSSRQNSHQYLGLGELSLGLALTIVLNKKVPYIRRTGRSSNFLNFTTYGNADRKYLHQPIVYDVCAIVFGFCISIFYKYTTESS